MSTLAEPTEGRDARHLSVERMGALALEHWPWVVLAVCVVVAAAARMVNLTSVPRGFFSDEASYGLNASLILHSGRDEYGRLLPLFFRAFGEFKLPLFIYGDIPFIAVLGRTELGVRMASACFGTLTVITTYLLARELFRRELPALTAAATLAVLPWHIHYSRTGFGEVVILPLVFTTAFYLFFRAMRDHRFIIPSAIAIGLTFYAYRPAWITVPLMLAVMLVAYRDVLWAHRRAWGIAGIIVLLMLTPIAYHLFLTDSGDRSTQASILANASGTHALSLAQQYYRSYFTDSFLFTHSDNSAVVRHYLPGQGELYYWQLPLILIGIVALLGRPNRRYVFVLALLLLYPVSAAVSDSSPISTRSILGTVAFSLLTGAGLWALVETIKSQVALKNTYWTVGPIAIFAALGLLAFGSYVSRYHSDYPAEAEGYWGWQYGPKQIIEHFEDVQDNYDELYLDGALNSPNVLIPFFAGDDCPKCRIGDGGNYDPAKRQLFALRPETLMHSGLEYRVIDTLPYLDGSVAFQYVEFTGKAP